MSNAELARTEPAFSDDERRQQYIGRGWWASIPLTIVPAHWLGEGQLRLDAGYYAESAAAALRVVTDCGQETADLSTLVSQLSYPNRFKRVYAKSHVEGVAFLTASEMLQFRPSSKEYLARKSNAVEICSVTQGTLIVTRSGTVGRCTIASKRLSRFAISDDAIRIRAEKVPVGYLYAFLSSWIGQALIVKDQYGSAIKHLEPHHLAKVPVPLLPEIEQEAIHAAIEKAFALRDEANDLLDEADQMLHQEVGLPVFDESLVPYLQPPELSGKAASVMPHPQAFTLKSSDLNDRFDVSYHIPVVKMIAALLQEGRHEVVRLDSLATGIRIPPRFKRIYVKKEFGVPFIRPSHLPQVRPYDLGYISHLTPVMSQLRLNEGEVLITTDGTVGRIGLVTSKTDGWAGSNNIARVIYGKEDGRNGFLAAFLSTPYGYYQLAREIFGGVIDHIEESQIRSVLIPNPPPEVQSAIGQLVVRAYEKKDEASALEALAIRECEEALMNNNDQTIKSVQKPMEPESEADRFRSFVKQVMSVPKSEIDKREAEYQSKKAEKKKAPK